ncbi:MAG: hypothetical protein BGP24_08560 [Lysobacterales bacterium 69-70]|nr:hypothetical protein [Xanthomonadaceae bacterium]ODU34513.1 MAG: hypothetical protein ABS97_07910 [Xanthomonadaceae bacterium SCN 69-320]OJY94766.1 MAG: hypothetical protein BGP24_08560 [Xanthomonadales bacterium 69-70]
MKIQALAYAVLSLCGLAAVHAAEPAAKPATAAPRAESADEARMRAAENLTEQQIKSTTNREALSRLAQFYNGRDLQRFIWSMQRLVELYPNSGALRLQLAAVYAGQGDKSNTYDTLLKMQNLGFAYSIGNDPRFEKVHGTKVWEYAVANLDANAKPFGEGKVAVQLPAGDTLLEALAWDSKRKQLLVGSARDGAIHRVEKDGKLADFIKPDPASGLYSVLDLKADAANDVLWVASYGAPVYKSYTAEMVDHSYLLKYSLSSGKLLGKYSIEDKTGHLFGFVAVAGDGRVYVADPARREIFKLDGDKLVQVTSNSMLTGISGLAVSSDGRNLYFADPALGLFGMDLSTARPFSVGHSPDSLVVGGVSSLFWYDGSLILVQDNMVPQRVMRLKLDKDGRNVVTAMPLDAAKPEFTMLGNGAVAGDDFYFVANSQRELYDSHGVLSDAKLLQPIKVYKSNLRFAWDQPGISAGLKPIPAAGDAKVRFENPEPAPKQDDNK